MKSAALWLLIILAGFSAEVRAAEAPAPPDALQQLKQILNQDPYMRWKRRVQRSEQPPSEFWASLRALTADLLDRLGKFLRDLWPSSGEYGPSGWSNFPLGKSLLWLGIAVGVVVVAGLAWVGFVSFKERRRGVRMARVLTREQIRRALDNAEATAMNAPDWLAAGERFAREGDSRALYRALYLALLSGLHSSNRIDFRRTRTNWTYVRTYRGPEEERRVFASLTEVFDRVWYGLAPADPALMADVRRQVVQLLPKESVHA